MWCAGQAGSSTGGGSMAVCVCQPPQLPTQLRAANQHSYALPLSASRVACAHARTLTSSITQKLKGVAVRSTSSAGDCVGRGGRAGCCVGF